MIFILDEDLGETFRDLIVLEESFYVAKQMRNSQREFGVFIAACSAFRSLLVTDQACKDHNGSLYRVSLDQNNREVDLLPCTHRPSSNPILKCPAMHYYREQVDIWTQPSHIVMLKMPCIITIFDDSRSQIGYEDEDVESELMVLPMPQNSDERKHTLSGD